MKTTSPYSNMFTETKCLSFQELDLYAKGSLSAKEKHRIEEHLTDCELCSAAVSGFAIAPVTAGDISSLHKSIDSMSRKKHWYSSNWFIGIASMLVLVGIWIIAAKPFAKKQSLAHNAPSTEQYVEDQKIPPPSWDFKNETGVATDPQKTAPKENFIKQKVKEEKPVAVTPAPEPNTPVTSTQPVTPVKPEVKPSAEEKEEIIVQKYNAPVRYIEDLKVTDFEKYYTIASSPFKNTPGHIPAYKENKDKKSPFDEIPETERSVGADEVLAKGLKSFNKKDWSKAMTQFNILLDVNSKDVNALFYKGVCAWNMDRPLIAQKCLLQVLENNNNVFHQEAKWYLALTYIKAGETDSAKETLQEIVKEKGFYSKRAKEKLNAVGSGQ